VRKESRAGEVQGKVKLLSGRLRDKPATIKGANAPKKECRLNKAKNGGKSMGGHRRGIPCELQGGGGGLGGLERNQVHMRLAFSDQRMQRSDSMPT